MLTKDPSEDSEQGLAYGEEASSKDDSQDTSSAPDETEITKGSLEERASTIGEGQYEHTSQPNPSPVCSSPSSFSYIFSFPLPCVFHFSSFIEISFSNRGEDGFIFGLVFLGPEDSYPQSSVRPPSDSDVGADHSTASHLLGLDLLSLSTSQKDAFCVALAVLASAPKAPQSKVFISEALTQTSSIFPTLDRALKFNIEISSKLDALKRQKIELEQAQLIKKQATQRLSELCTDYDAQKECIRILIAELEKENMKLTSLVEQGEAIKAHWLAHL